MSKQIYLTTKEAKFLYAVMSNFRESADTELTEDGAEKLAGKLKRAALKLDKTMDSLKARREA